MLFRSILWIICFGVTLYILDRRDQLSTGMFILALIIWPVALIAAAMLPPKDEPNGLYWPTPERPGGTGALGSGPGEAVRPKPGPLTSGSSELIRPIQPTEPPWQSDYGALGALQQKSKRTNSSSLNITVRKAPAVPKANWRAFNQSTCL